MSAMRCLARPICSSITARNSWGRPITRRWALPCRPSIGAQLANPKLRPLVLVGDGAFQMTGMELATAVRYKLNPIVIVLNNAATAPNATFRTGRITIVAVGIIIACPKCLGAGRGFRFRPKSELERRLECRPGAHESFCLLDVQLDPLDRSPALQRLAERLAQRL